MHVARALLKESKAEEASAKAALEAARATAADLDKRHADNSKGVQELQSELDQLREQLTTGDQSVQVSSSLMTHSFPFVANTALI